MEDKKLVTVEEMEDLLAKEASEFVMPCIFGSIISRHLYAERLLQKDYEEVEWLDECPFPILILDFAKTWMHPLVWQDTSKYKDLVIDGRVAEEEYDDDRYLQISGIVDYIYEQDILEYADEPIVYDEDNIECGFSRGMHDWSTLTWDVKSYIDKVLEGRAFDGKEMEKKYYNFIRLRYNLNIIAEHRGGERAAQLLKMLQNEWTKIEQWESGFNLMDEKDIAEFKEKLFHGFDDLLEEWEAETPKEETPKQEASAPAKQRGPKTQYLFADVRGNEDTFRSKTEAERVRKFVADHRMGNMQLDSQSTNRLNLMVACFWYRWNERGWVSKEPQGAAIYRFFTEQCELECAVRQKAFSSKICKIINEGKKDYQIYDDLDSYFRK